jgi:hypothetical protein
MSQAARESLALADRTQRVARWVVVLAWVVGAVGVIVLVRAGVAVGLVVSGRSDVVQSSGAVALVVAAVALLVQAAVLALLARYTQLRSADVRASRAYEAAIAGALADLMRKREDQPVSEAEAAATAAVVAGTAGTASGTPAWRPHTHSAEARAEQAAAPSPGTDRWDEPAPVAVEEPAALEPMYADLVGRQQPVETAVAAPVVAAPEPLAPEAVVEPVATTAAPEAQRPAWIAAALDLPAADPVVTYPAAVPAAPDPVVEPVVTHPFVAGPAVAEPVVPEAVTAAAAVEPVVAEPVVAQPAATVVVAPETGLPVAGWYPDPAGPGQRWWDGLQWTTATR